MSLEYNETQYFRHPLIIALVAGVAVITWYTILIEGDTMGPVQLLLLAVIGILIPLLFATLRLETRVSVDGIIYRMPPVVWKKRIIPWNDLLAVDLITVRPIRDCGGWGIRFCLGEGIAYIVSGNQVIRCTKKTKEKVLLGTRHPEEIMTAIRTYFS
ncbi:MAG: hypothetical protein D5R96_03155 [Methanocalculus sp. MSAO_Arc2]|uniref:hypothetical protein n=1 Tax=Methanocalculus sp. MSAO_Arc2 TaxID=2293855 RepID=UPI000FEF72FE|nr:MAG: hypothetical protein D5R96_03155 [Methanocalculus sp. MSAO_Arc2]